MRFLFVILALTFVSLPVLAQSTWEDLIRDVQTPVGKSPDRPIEKLEDQSVTSDAPIPDSEEAASDGGVSAKIVLTYKCENPNFPDCLKDMRRFEGMVDIDNCKEVTKLYLSAVASFNRCIDKRSKAHARNIVDYFNCYAGDRKNCPRLFPD